MATVELFKEVAPDDNMTGEKSADFSDSDEKTKIINGVIEFNDSRIKRKAKRPSKFVVKDFKMKPDCHMTAPLRALKNSRKSRNIFGRGLPKKGGAGGKGTWGRLGSEILEEVSGAMDANDPNYDADLNNKDVKLKVIDLENDDEYSNAEEKKVTLIVLEYFDSGDTEEVLRSLQEINPQPTPYRVIAVAIELSLDHKPSHREMMSVLLADLYSYFFNEDDYAKAFDELLQMIEDLTLDTPEAPIMIGNFIARAIADDCIPPKFLQAHKGKMNSELAIKALFRAESFLSLRHGLVRLDNVWGVGGGTRPVKHLVNKMILLLKEYVSSDDVNEATRCLQELEVPHFHHELVYEAVNIVIEDGKKRTNELILRLLKSLCNSVVITPNQVKDGFLRVYEDMPQIALDVPHSYTILENFVRLCADAGILSADVAKKVPTRARKRVVSEGDGGRFKDLAYL